jgi:hypothetical protein
MALALAIGGNQEEFSVSSGQVNFKLNQLLEQRISPPEEALGVYRKSFYWANPN